MSVTSEAALFSEKIKLFLAIICFFRKDMVNMYQICAENILFKYLKKWEQFKVESVTSVAITSEASSVFLP